MLFYYRLLGLVVIAGLLLSGAALYAVISYLGSSVGLTLTLAGVTGIIVSVGVTVDSYIVYYERLKDEVRAGSTVRACVDRAFTRSFRTILAADLVSLIGAGVLYWLAIGSVRGFALYLGLSTVLDLLGGLLLHAPARVADGAQTRAGAHARRRHRRRPRRAGGGGVSRPVHASERPRTGYPGPQRASHRVGTESGQA